MAFRFSKRVKILPGVTINLGKKGASVSVGGRGARMTFDGKGRRTTIGIPGTGVSYSSYEKYSDNPYNGLNRKSSNTLVIIIVIIIIAVLIAIFLQTNLFN